ncbi:4-(cytidine 5'-diphospho)-2-C-methyl-D-erythritol kinase [Hirschia baltica]|uniref:4-diphosphocytidyl-2-C-methyl-D-erythritol kinase n=1 Tax=Hirschia baltica (strain ATCC 49814 / DSM 5838 / IFAM 1418) TaxID=582402 RepID=C6XRD7_HIRBI|nr:4-(cytidine 5'-diphospho)-2-C-methyl-D-erythritol kinase [Hirschia baltica]ACT58769.1 4-diphosphocytidyl-2C-methyl-D-erythritol kinase [Hirschia baltica ATCC 49814]
MIDRATSLSTVWAPAKVNLYLHVGKPLPDGRHPLDSLVMFADGNAADRVSVRPYQTVVLKVDGPAAKALKGEKNNLVLRAAKLLMDAAGRSDLGAALNLHKELPVAAGIGGGSADAAATLQALNHYWDIGFGDQAILNLGAELGADVPACLQSEPVLMRGIGEQLTPFKMQPLPIVLVNPNVPLSTADVFKKFDAMGLGSDFKEREGPDSSGGPEVLARSLERYSNDLEVPAKILCPAVKDVLDTIEKTEGALMARMSGSGPTCFGVFETMEAAQAAAYIISKRKKKWWVKASLLSGSR